MSENKSNKEKLNILLDKETEPIKRVKSVFPFTIFPDYIMVYRNKILVIKRYFPFGRRVFPILLEHLKTVTVSTGPFFASVFFEVSGFEKNPRPVSYLLQKDAFEVRRLISGLSFIHTKKIDVDNLSDDKLISKAMKLG